MFFSLYAGIFNMFNFYIQLELIAGFPDFLSQIIDTEGFCKLVKNEQFAIFGC